jgi:putative hydrolase of the HAD superfamily
MAYPRARGRRRVRDRPSAVSAIEAVISDFGGVLTSPLIDAFTGFGESAAVTPEQLGQAIAAVAQRDGNHPLHELETGRISEAAFLTALDEELQALGHPAEMRAFTEVFFAHLHPNERMIDYMRELKGRGYRLGICTNNIREWESRWRAMLPIELFADVVDSAFVGVRKPEPEIYRLSLEGLGVAAEQALFLDDVELNCEGARELGIRSVWFQTSEQAIAEIEQALS